MSTALQLLTSVSMGLSRPIVLQVEIARLSAYFGHYIGDPNAGSDATYHYFHRLRKHHHELKTRLLRNWWHDGQPPLTVEHLLDLALEVVADRGTALLVCNNVLQSMARGSKLLPWHRVGDWQEQMGEPPPFDPSLLRPLGATAPIQATDYYDGQLVYRPQKVHEAGEAVDANGKPSIWHLLFDKSSSQLTGANPGDWYHFFLMATIGYYGGHSFFRVRDLQEVRAPETEKGQGAWLLVGTLMYAMNQYEGVLREGPDWGALSGARLAWVWGNAVSFTEGSVWGADQYPPTAEQQADVQHESGIHRRGLMLGLGLLGESEPASAGYWFVPVAGRAAPIRSNKWQMAAFIVAISTQAERGLEYPNLTAGAFARDTGQFIPLAELPGPTAGPTPTFDPTLPKANQGKDLAIPVRYQANVAQAFHQVRDLIDDGPAFRQKWVEIMSKLTGSTVKIDALRAALVGSRINLAVATVNEAVIRKAITGDDRGLPLADRPSGYSRVGKFDVWIRPERLSVGGDALAGTLLHELSHVAGAPGDMVSELALTALPWSDHLYR